MIQNYPTIDDVLKYEEMLVDAVEKQLNTFLDPKAKTILLKLQVLLKTKAVKTFAEQLRERKFSLSSFKKIQEIDDALDKLKIMSLQLPYPEECFINKQRKMERAINSVMTALLCAILGFEWVE